MRFLQECHNRNGNAALTSYIKRVIITYISDVYIKVVTKILLDKAFDFAFHIKHLGSLYVDRGCNCLRTLNAFGMIVAHRCCDAGKLQCLLHRVGIQSNRAYTHSRAISKAVVWLWIVG